MEEQREESGSRGWVLPKLAEPLVTFLRLMERNSEGFEAGQDAVNRTCIFVNRPGKLFLAGFSGKGRDQILAFPSFPVASNWPIRCPCHFGVGIWQQKHNPAESLELWATATHTASRGTAGTTE